nr:immunoglobulin light chain junction region [Macaca mulatta]
CLHYKSLPYTF